MDVGSVLLLMGIYSVIAVLLLQFGNYFPKRQKVVCAAAGIGTVLALAGCVAKGQSLYLLILFFPAITLAGSLYRLIAESGKGEPVVFDIKGGSYRITTDATVVPVLAGLSSVKNYLLWKGSVFYLPSALQNTEADIRLFCYPTERNNCFTVTGIRYGRKTGKGSRTDRLVTWSLAAAVLAAPALLYHGFVFGRYHDLSRAMEDIFTMKLGTVLIPYVLFAMAKKQFASGNGDKHTRYLRIFINAAYIVVCVEVLAVLSELFF